MAAVFGRKSRTFFIEAQLDGRSLWKKITKLLYRGTASGHSLWTKITKLLYRGTAPGRGLWTEITKHSSWPQPLDTAPGRSLWTEITNLLYRGTAPGHGLWAKARPFFVEAQLLAAVFGRNSRCFSIEAHAPGHREWTNSGRWWWRLLLLLLW